MTTRWLTIALLLAPAGCSSSRTSTSPPRPSSADTPGKAPADDTFTFENPGGMWMPAQMSEHADTLRKLGVEFDPAALQDPTQFPLNAVVSLGGCSASFVSDQGLVITNHHCVTQALQHNSTPERNMLQDGFLAKTLEDEPTAGPSQRIYVTTGFTDVTDKVLSGLETIEDPAARAKELDSRVEDLREACTANNEHGRCRIASYFEGAQYVQIEQLEIRDVRLVYAPHAGVGVYGGEVDNWRWPRHTGDYSFLRAYVAPDGTPAPYNKNNVPYQPPHHLRVASNPLKPGDFAMVAGYPGRTYRLKTADEVATATQWSYPNRIARNEAYIETVEALTTDNPELAIKAASYLRRLHNSLTNAKGMRDGLTKGGLLEQKREVEQAMRAWIDADPAREAEYGQVLVQLQQVSDELAKTRVRDDAVAELLRASTLLRVAGAMWRTAERRDEGKLKPEEIAMLGQRLTSMSKSYAEELDRAKFSLALQRTSSLPEQDRPTELLRLIVGDNATFPLREATITRALDRLYGKSKLDDAARRVRMLKSATEKSLGRSRDPFVALFGSMKALNDEMEARTQRVRGEMTQLRPQYVAALRAYANEPFAPDANSTLRVSFGTVRGYRPTANAPMYEPFTTLDQMLAKHTGETPFVVPAHVMAAAKTAKSSPYVDETLGDVPLDFLADLDITGGNSGSATLNAKGELVGLAFDGNYESIASDWVFMPNVTRSIHVDIRYVLWMMDYVEGAHRLMREMGIEPANK